MNKQEILDKVLSKTAEELAGYISKGIVSLDELRATGDLFASKRKDIEKILPNNPSQSPQHKVEDTDRSTVLPRDGEILPPKEPQKRSSVVDDIQPKPAGGVMTKDIILANVGSINANDLSDYISKGIVTLNELMGTGDLDPSIRKRIQELLKQREQEEDDMWTRVSYGNESDLRDYISKYPAGKYVDEARELIDRIRILKGEKEKERQTILNNIQKECNAYTPGMIRDFLDNGTISQSDLAGLDIPSRIIDKIINFVPPPHMHMGKTSGISIPEGYTEVYFWGISGSGKTCALAAILSTAEKLGYLDIAVGPGYDYMTRLKNIFDGQIATLPPATHDYTQYLPFVLKRSGERPHSVSLIEMSGEIFQCFYRKNAGLALTDQYEDTFNTLIQFLKGKNRKIHFFFIDFDRENKKDKDGYTQSDYLRAASTFFQNEEVFNKNTDAIYVVITKSDLMPCGATFSERIDYAKIHLQTHNFSAFINVLKDRCRQFGINGGKLTVEPFSLGKVCFQYLCDFDDSTAERFIEILIDRIPEDREGVFDFFNR